MIPLMPSPGSPNTVSTPQSMRRSISTSPAIFFATVVPPLPRDTAYPLAGSPTAPGGRCYRRRRRAPDGSWPWRDAERAGSGGVIADVAGLVISLVVLVVGGDQFVIGVGRLAASLRVRPTVVGAVVGGFGTSLPELIVAGVATAR